MKIERQLKIADSFSENFTESELDIDLSLDEFEILKKGFFSTDMDVKWNIFIVDKNLYLSRSWTDYCIYKVSFIENRRRINLNKIKVSRDSELYKGNNLDAEIKTFKKILQMYLKRDNLFVDERLNLGLIKETIEKLDDKNNYKKSIGLQSIELNLQIYKSLVESSSEYIKVIGLENLEMNSKKYNPKYELLSLHISNMENPKKSTTYFFNQEATELIGQITTQRI